jgi:glyoxylase-like metal-dependent hydrolase (beta-lactamase superfamily II)
MTLLIPDSPEYSPIELTRLLEAGEPVQIMDVRAPERLASGRVDLGPESRFHNIRGSVLIKTSSVEETGLDPDLPVAVICGRGKDSRIVTNHLRGLGLDARSLSGGLDRWFEFLYPRTLDPPEGVDTLTQFDRVGKGCLAYLLVSEGEALIVDPPYAFRPILEAVEEAGIDVVGVADTHVHADYISGGPQLSKGLGVPYYLHPADAVSPYDGTPGILDFAPLADGQRIPFGGTYLRVDHTPGHTEGSVTYVLEDRVAFTGDFLLLEALGRPDLGEKAEEWARVLWGSVLRARNEWAPGTAILPAHYTDPASHRPDGSVAGHFGDLLRKNKLLSLEDEEEFVKRVVARSAPFPAAYKTIKAVNLGLIPVQEEKVAELEVGRNECGLASS